MLIAFNAAPGTVAPNESGSYGVYAQSLAEMIRTGGLSLPDVFDRVRLRVSETSKGAQIPWDAQKIQAQFTFFDRAPDAPPVQGANWGYRRLGLGYAGGGHQHDDSSSASNMLEKKQHEG